MRTLAVAAAVMAAASVQSSGTLITYVSGSGVCARQLGSSAPLDLYESSGDIAALAWSPDGSLLALEVYDPQSDARRILLMREDGSFTNNVPPLGRHPSFAPDAHRLVYASSGDLVIRDIHTWARRVLTHGRRDRAPTWSPAGGSIAFTRAHDLYVMRADGRRARKVTANATDPSWAPDGRRLAYVRGGRLWVIGVDGTRARRVSSAGTGVSTPAWSPDGSLIAYGTERGIQLVSPNGGGPHLLTSHGLLPAWRTGSARPLPSSRFGTCQR
jgi:Tol biopolymer transport system component